MRVLFFGLAMLVAVPQLFAQGNAPTYDVNRVGDAAPVIDGIVSPGEWDAAATAAGGWVDLRTHQPDTHNLRFQALWDDENIYLLGQSDWDAFPEGPSVQPSNPNFGGGSYNPNFYFDPNTDDEVFLSDDWVVDGYQFTWDVFEGHAERRPTEGSPTQPLRDPLDENGDFINDYLYGVFLEAHANTAFGNNGLFDLSNDGPNADYRDDNHPGFVLAQTASNDDLNGTGAPGAVWEVAISFETLNATDPNRLVTQEEADSRGPEIILDEREFLDVPDPEDPAFTIEIENPDFGLEVVNVGQFDGIGAFIGEAGTPDLRFSDPESGVFIDNGLFAVDGPEPGDVWGFETSIITPDQTNNFLPSWSEPADDGRVNGQDGDRNSFAPWGNEGHGRLIFIGDGEPVGPVGDIDGDGEVAFSDFLILSDAFGTMVEPGTSGDLDGDGSVAFADFLLFSDNFGATAAAASVPEPSAFCLMLLGILPLLRRRRR